MRNDSVVGRAALCAGLLALTLAGCQSTKTGAEQTGSQPTGSEFDQGPGTGGAAGSSAGAGTSVLEAVYFDFDRYTIRADASGTLRNNATAITSNEALGIVTIEGHCDERGSEEYNLALGERRASAVKRYLVDLGVSGGRLRTVSFGEAKPAVVGHDESAWRYNRRSEFKGGG
jgi:peptidoglycan-associated lipoprotein